MKHARSLLTCLLLAPSAALHSDDKTPKKLSEAEARQFRAAAEYSRSAHGISVLVMRRGEIVFEDYAPGWQDKRLFTDEKPYPIHLSAEGYEARAKAMQPQIEELTKE